MQIGDMARAYPSRASVRLMLEGTTVHRFANPARFLNLARPLTPVCVLAGTLLIVAGLYGGLLVTPPDYLQGESVRVMYVHVPAAWLGMAGYGSLAAASAAYLVWRHPLADVAARAIAPIGAIYTAICLVSGSIWGRPTWGTWWEWDGRLTSMLILLFLYLGYIALSGAGEDRERAAKSSAILALVGAVNLPIIRYSVVWWNTLHQGSSITLSGSSIDRSILWPLPLTGFGFTLLFAGFVLMRMRADLARTKVDARMKRLAEAA